MEASQTQYTLIIQNKSKKLDNYIQKYKAKDDEIIYLNSLELNKELNSAITKAKGKYIFIFHHLFSSFNEDYISKMKELLGNNNLVVCDNPEIVTLNKLTKNSAIGFHKDHYKEINKKLFDLIIFQRQMLMKMKPNINVIRNCEKEEIVPEKKTQKVKKPRNIRKKSARERRLANRHNQEKIERKKIHFNFDHRKPKILILADVIGWAWWIKAEYLKKHLASYYDIDIINLIGKNKKTVNPNKYDLYFTFGYSYVRNIMSVPYRQRISGVTAHRPHIALKSPLSKVYATHANSVLLYNELKTLHKYPFYTPNGVDTDLFYEKHSVLEDHDNPIFGHVGKKGKMKNQSHIIEPAIKRAYVKYYPHYNTYENKIAHEKMVDVHQKYDVFVAMSSEDGTPNGLLESAACGRPAIINKIGNAPELIENGYNGFVIEKNIDALVETLKWFEKNPDKIYEMGQNAKKEIQEKWTWEILCNNYKYMFDKVLNITRDFEEYDNPSFYHI